MAKIEQVEPRMHLREQWPGAVAGRRPVMPVIHWGSVSAGVAVGMSVHLVLSLFGIASGLAALDADRGDVGAGTIAWAAVSLLTASFAGGFVAARMSGLRRKTDGLLHGAVSWAVATLLYAALSVYAGGMSVGDVFGGPSPPTASEAQADDYRLTLLLRGMIGGDVSVADMQTLQRYVRAGQREEATLILSAMGMDPIQAATVVDRAIMFNEGTDKDAAQATPATQSPGSAAWIVFGGVLLSLLLGLTGGLVGALGSRRLVWSKPDVAGGRSAEIASS